MIHIIWKLIDGLVWKERINLFSLLFMFLFSDTCLIVCWNAIFDFLKALSIFSSFRGNDYEQHVKCISEEEKYSGKDYKPKANANKGEVKQEAWTRVGANSLQHTFCLGHITHRQMAPDIGKTFGPLPDRRTGNHMMKNRSFTGPPKLLQDLIFFNIIVLKTGSL